MYMYIGDHIDILALHVQMGPSRYLKLCVQSRPYWYYDCTCTVGTVSVFDCNKIKENK